MDLLDLLREQDHAEDPRTSWVHVVLPTMSYVCDGGPLGLTDGGPSGKWVLGAGTTEQWASVTCPDCRAPGRKAVSRRCHLQQKPVDHECPPPDQTDNPGCQHWQSIPEGE